jgi:hypothetical protein
VDITSPREMQRMGGRGTFRGRRSLYWSPAERIKYEQTRAAMARQRVEQRHQQELEALEKRQCAVDVEVDIAVEDRLNMFLMVFGFLFAIALACCVVGLMSTSARFYADITGIDTTTNDVLVGYGSWSEFTAACCCFANDAADDTPYHTVERWTCANGRQMERLRSQNIYTDASLASQLALTALVRADAMNMSASNQWLVDGFAVRPLCGVTFASGCTFGTANATCDASTGISNYEMNVLW